MKTLAFIALDLRANTGRCGWLWGIKSFIFEPSFYAVTLFRWSRMFLLSGNGGLSKLIWRFNVLTTGCYLSPKADIGAGLALPHPTGVVIGEDVKIGSNAVLYQSVTLGRNIKTGQYPILGNDVICYPNTIIIGGVNVGNKACIGAGSIVMRDVAEQEIISANGSMPDRK